MTYSRFNFSIAALSPWKKSAVAAVALFSLGAAHYAGFMSAVPPELRDVAAERFAAKLLIVLSLYVAASLAFARLLLAVLQPVVWLPLAVTMRLFSRSGKQFAKRYIRLVQIISDFSLILTFIAAILLLLFSYTYTSLTSTLLNFVIVLLILATLFRLHWFVLQPRNFVGGVTTSRHRIQRMSAAALVASISAAVVGAILLGYLRFRHQLETRDVAYSSPCLSVVGKIIIATEEIALLHAKETEGRRFVLVGKDYVVAAQAETDFSTSYLCKDGK